MVTEEIVDGYITYSELSAVLRDIEKDSDRIKIDVVGKSAGGRNTLTGSKSYQYAERRQK
jgi:hypothetical protein